MASEDAFVQRFRSSFSQASGSLLFADIYRLQQLLLLGSGQGGGVKTIAWSPPLFPLVHHQSLLRSVVREVLRLHLEKGGYLDYL